MSTFFHSLKPEERRILRKIVKHVHFKYYPKDFMTDFEADKYIAAIAPEAAANLVRLGKDRKIDEV
nr:hypothetical protein [uncultured Mediterranean phage uvMED]